jgi:hypothetical protein
VIFILGKAARACGGSAALTVPANATDDRNDLRFIEMGFIEMGFIGWAPSTLYKLITGAGMRRFAPENMMDI